MYPVNQFMLTSIFALLAMHLALPVYNEHVLNATVDQILLFFFVFWWICIVWTQGTTGQGIMCRNLVWYEDQDNVDI